MKTRTKKYVIFQEFPSSSKTIFNKNLRKINLTKLTEADREYIQSCLRSSKITPYSSDNLEVEITEGFSQVYFLCRNPRLRKINKMKLSNHENFTYKFSNQKKAFFKTFCKKSMSFIYNLTRILVLILIGILTYLLIALSHLKWPEFNKKDKDKSKCDDDPNASGCCSCEEIKEKGESMSKRVKNQIKDSEYMASKERLKNLTTVGAIGTLLSVPFSNQRRTEQEQQILDSMEKDMETISSKISKLERTHLYGCDCTGLHEKFNAYRSDIQFKLRNDCKLDVDESAKVSDYVQQYTKYLKQHHICEPEFGQSLTEMVGKVADSVYSGQERLIT